MMNWHEDCFARDCTRVHTIKHREVYRVTYYDCWPVQNEVYWIPTLIFLEFWILESEFQFLNFSRAGFKINLTGIFGIKNRIGIPLTMGVPKIGTKNQNSQPRGQEPIWSCPGNCGIIDPSGNTPQSCSWRHQTEVRIATIPHDHWFCNSGGQDKA